MSGKQHQEMGIQIVGACENNLKNLNINLPIHQIVALSGTSGAGKSTLAHQIVATTARRRLGRLRGESHWLAPCYQPLVSKVENLPPCIEFKQEPLHGQSRSTVATFSGMLDLISELFLNFGKQYSIHGKEVTSLKKTNLAAWIKYHYEGRFLTLAKIRTDILVSSTSSLPSGRFLWRSEKEDWIFTTRSRIKLMLPTRGSIAELGQKILIKNDVNLDSVPRPTKDSLIWLIDDLILGPILIFI